MIKNYLRWGIDMPLKFIVKMNGQKELIEKLADIEHQRWADWQKYLHSKCIKDEKGNLIISAEFVKHLERQIETPYSELFEKEKESDREQVMRYWNLINKHEVAN